MVIRCSLHSLVFEHPRELLKPQVLVEVRALGYRAIELVPIDYENRDIDELRAACDRVGLEVLLGWSLGPEHHLADSARAPLGVAHMKSLVDTAARLGAPLVSGVTYAGCGALSGAPPVQKELDCAADAVRQICDHAATVGVTICMEPAVREDSHIINTVEQAVAFRAAVDRPNCALLLDTFQMLREENDIGAAIRRARGLIELFHVSESHRGTPGTGTVPWQEVGRALRDIEYDGWIGVEAFFDPGAVVAPRAKVWRRLGESPLALAKAAMLHIEAILA